jgi:hypothetical protein
MRLALLPLLVLSPLMGQDKPPAPPKSTVQQLADNWSDVARKINAMAEEFPEAKYDYKPTPDVRTFADQLLHLAFWNQFVTKTAKGEKPDPSLNVLPRSQYKTKADITAVVKSSFADLVATLKTETYEKAIKQIRLWDEFIEHAGEHYGQLVMYYRLSGLVPPESKKP